MLYIIFNPNAGRGTAARHESEVRAALDASGLPYAFVRTEGVGHAERLAAAAAERGSYRAIVAAGGDGTINEVVNGMLGASLPLALLPLGTGNDLVKMFGLRPNRPADAIARIRAGTVRWIDVGCANGRAFVNGLGCGLDAQIAVETRRPTRLRGFAVYLAALVRALRHYKAPHMRVSYGTTSVEQRMTFAAVGNGRCQGGGFWLTPQARIDDGLLDLCVCSYLRLDEIVRHVPKVMRGTHGRLKQVAMAQIRQAMIETSAPVPVHIDGEIIGTALREVTVEIRPAALPVLA